MILLEYIKRNLVGLTTILWMAILLIHLPFDNFKFIGLAIFISIGFVYAIVRNREIQWNSGFDFFFFGFIVLSFLSAFWAPDISTVWYNSFTWLLMWLMVVLLRSIQNKEVYLERWLSYLFIGYFIILLLHHLMAVQFGVSLNEDWNAFLYRNNNYTVTFLTALFPFLLFYKSDNQFVRFMKIISLVLLLNLIFITNVRGALLSLMVVLVLKMWVMFSDNPGRRYVSVVAGLSLIIGGIVFFNKGISETELPIQQQYLKEYPAKSFMQQRSIDIFKEHPLKGSGTGSWYQLAYSKSVAGITPFSDPNKFVRHRSHNLYFRLLAENGVVGFVLFIIPWLLILVGGIRKLNSRNSFGGAALGCMLVYLVASFFYATSNSYSYLFSNIQLLAFVSIGMLSGNNVFVIKGYGMRHLLLIASLMTFTWFVYTKWVYNRYKKAETEIRQGNSTLARGHLSAIWSPIFQNSIDESISIPMLLAEQYSALSDSLNADVFYHIALKSSPYSCPVLLSYAKYLIYEKKDLNEGKKVVQKMLDLQPSSNSAKLLMADILLKNKKYEEVEKWLSNLEDPDRNILVKAQSIRDLVPQN